MTTELLPLCGTPKIALRDGYAGEYAHIMIPFYGLYFANGQELTFNSATAAQSNARTLGGTRKPNTYVKAAGVCMPS